MRREYPERFAELFAKLKVLDESNAMDALGLLVVSQQKTGYRYRERMLAESDTHAAIVRHLHARPAPGLVWWHTRVSRLHLAP